MFRCGDAFARPTAVGSESEFSRRSDSFRGDEREWFISSDSLLVSLADGSGSMSNPNETSFNSTLADLLKKTTAGAFDGRLSNEDNDDVDE